MRIVKGAGEFQAEAEERAGRPVHHGIRADKWLMGWGAGDLRRQEVTGPKQQQGPGRKSSGGLARS